jgi:hypothetical protein
MMAWLEPLAVSRAFSWPRDFERGWSLASPLERELIGRETLEFIQSVVQRGWQIWSLKNIKLKVISHSTYCSEGWPIWSLRQIKLKVIPHGDNLKVMSNSIYCWERLVDLIMIPYEDNLKVIPYYIYMCVYIYIINHNYIYIYCLEGAICGFCFEGFWFLIRGFVWFLIRRLFSFWFADFWLLVHGFKFPIRGF